MNNYTNSKETRVLLLQLSNKVSFLKDTLVDMSNNLINLHKLKIYDSLNHGYTDIADELTNIKKQLKRYPDFFKNDYLNKRNITMEKLDMELND